MNNPRPLRYWAFISYSNKDRRWGEWLRKRIENYVIPRALRRRALPDGAVLGKHIRPVFRDRDELPGAENLGESIRSALTESRYLVVLCSPHSAQSKWVNKEISEFREMGKGKNILALILNGEPNSGNPETECFPQGLRLPHEPLAGDLRRKGDGTDRGFLKILAGIANLDFDALYKRHERTARRARLAFAATTLSLMILFASLAAYAWVQRADAIRQREVADNQREHAERAKTEAVRQREVADDQRRQAEQAKTDAVRQRQVADDERKQAEHARAEAESLNLLAQNRESTLQYNEGVRLLRDGLYDEALVRLGAAVKSSRSHVRAYQRLFIEVGWREHLLPVENTSAPLIANGDIVILRRGEQTEDSLSRMRFASGEPKLLHTPQQEKGHCIELRLDDGRVLAPDPVEGPWYFFDILVSHMGKRQVLRDESTGNGRGIPFPSPDNKRFGVLGVSSPDELHFRPFDTLYLTIFDAVTLKALGSTEVTRPEGGDCVGVSWAGKYIGIRWAIPSSSWERFDILTVASDGSLTFVTNRLCADDAVILQSKNGDPVVIAKRSDGVFFHCVSPAVSKLRPIAPRDVKFFDVRNQGRSEMIELDRPEDNQMDASSLNGRLRVHCSREGVITIRKPSSETRILPKFLPFGEGGLFPSCIALDDNGEFIFLQRNSVSGGFSTWEIFETDGKEFIPIQGQSCTAWDIPNLPGLDMLGLGRDGSTLVFQKREHFDGYWAMPFHFQGTAIESWLPLFAVAVSGLTLDSNGEIVRVTGAEQIKVIRTLREQLKGKKDSAEGLALNILN